MLFVIQLVNTLIIRADNSLRMMLCWLPLERCFNGAQIVQCLLNFTRYSYILYITVLASKKVLFMYDIKEKELAQVTFGLRCQLGKKKNFLI